MPGTNKKLGDAKANADDEWYTNPYLVNLIMDNMVKKMPANTQFIFPADDRYSHFVKYGIDHHLNFKSSAGHFEDLPKLLTEKDKYHYCIVTNPPFHQLSRFFGKNKEGKYNYPELRSVFDDPNVSWGLIVPAVGWANKWSEPYSKKCNYYAIRGKYALWGRPGNKQEQQNGFVFATNEDIDWDPQYKMWAPKPNRNAKITYLPNGDAQTSVMWLQMHNHMKANGWHIKDFNYTPPNNQFKYITWTKETHPVANLDNNKIEQETKPPLKRYTIDLDE